MSDISTASLFRLKTSTSMPLTRQVLDDFRQLPPSPTERDLNEKRVERLSEKITTGRAIPFQWASAVLNGKEIRVNGQHSSEALVRMNGEMPADLQVHRDVYEVDTNEGLVHLFRQFDERMSGRTPLDVSGAYLKLEPALANVDPNVAKLAAEGIAWYDSVVVGGRKVVNDDRYAIYSDAAVHEFMIWADVLFSSKTRELTILPVVGAMWATWQVNIPETKTFWDLVARGGVIGDDAHPTTQLDDALRAMREKTRERAKPAQIYGGSIAAWNAYRSNNKVKTLKFDVSKGFPEPIE
jgi:hypothetical protein